MNISRTFIHITFPE